MASVIPSTPAGTRDFDSITLIKRRWIMSTIQTQFERHGFEPLETPAMENLEILLGKYGNEGDQLIFKILNNGLHQKQDLSPTEAAWQNHLRTGMVSPLLTERALRYDLTIPLARFVSTHDHELVFPFKRYQMQPVWRADKPQKGRYREFMQCDADIIGSQSLWDEIELIHLYLDVFTTLQLNIHLYVNHRLIIESLKACCQLPTSDKTLITTIDKIDKIGLDQVLKTLQEKYRFKNSQLTIIEHYLNITGNIQGQLTQLETLLAATPHFKQAYEELQFVFSHIHHINKIQVQLQPQLARGLDYYTGCVFEVKAASNELHSSIGGGGRYDNLTALFGKNQLPGIGISFGLDRIYDVLAGEQKFPQQVQVTPIKVLWLNLDTQAMQQHYPTLLALRAKGNNVSLYPKNDKMSKQLQYADRKHIPFVVIVGKQELENKTLIVKNMHTHEQVNLHESELLQFHFNT